VARELITTCYECGKNIYEGTRWIRCRTKTGWLSRCDRPLCCRRCFDGHYEERHEDKNKIEWIEWPHGKEYYLEH
jgi:hypothetical protein